MKIALGLFAAGMVLMAVSCARADTGSTAPNAAAPSAKDDYQLVWADEFDKDGVPDSANWGFETGFVRNQEDQWYQPENARVENGMLIIEARKERIPNPNYKPGSTDWKTSRVFADYTSASLSTSGKHSWTYGRFEMRARIDTRFGMWPAFWTVGTEGEWPSGGEIDIMEFYRGDLLANVAWGTNRRWNAKWHTVKRPLPEFNDPDWSKKFHVWRMDWTPESIKLYVDDYLMNDTPLTDTVNGDAEHGNPFQHPQFIILNLAIGGQNGGDPSKTEFPGKYEIDYVRVYQKKDAAAPGTPNP